MIKGKIHISVLQYLHSKQINQCNLSTVTASNFESLISMLKLKLQYFGHLMRRVGSLEKTDAGRDRGQEEKGTTEDEMAGWHHGLYGRESE